MLGFQPRKKNIPSETPQAGLGFRPRGADGAAFAQAQNQQPDSIPGMFKPGEFVLPPDTVHALGGKAVLQSAVEKTHTPSDAGAQVPLGFKPELFFAQGGAPEDELKKANNFGDAAAAMNNAGVTTPPAAAPSPGLSPGMAAPLPQETGDAFLSTPAARAGLTQGQMPAPRAPALTPPTPAPPALPPPAPPVSPPAAPVQAANPPAPLDRQAAADRSAIGSAWNAVKGVNDDAGRAIADVAMMVPRGLAGAYDSAVIRPMRAAGVNASYLSPSLVPNGVDPSSMTPCTDQKRNQEANAPGASAAGAGRGAVNPALAVPEIGAGGGRGFVSPASVNPALPTPSATQPSQANAAAAGTPSATGMVTREGNSYSGSNISGDISINGAAPRNGGRISAQNDMAAENLARGFRPGMGSEFAAAPQPKLGFGPGSVLERQQQGGFTGVIGQQSGNGNMWSRTPEQLRRDAEVQASSIHKPTSALGVGALRSMDAQDLETTRGFNNLQREAMQQTGANSRAAGQNAAELQRTAMREGGENTRFGFRSRSEAERNQMDRERFGLEKEAAGFKTRSAQQMQDLQRVYLDPNSSAEQRAQAQASLFALQGKSPEGRWKSVVLQGGTDAQGNKTESVLGAVNEQTGEMKRHDGGVKPAYNPPPNAIAMLKRDPSMASKFDEWYGAGASKKALGA